MDTTEIIGSIGATLTTISFLPQVIKVVKTKSTEDLSLGMFLMMFIGVLLWLVYGILLEKMPIIMANGVTAIFCSIILYYKLTAPKNS